MLPLYFVRERRIGGMSNSSSSFSPLSIIFEELFQPEIRSFFCLVDILCVWIFGFLIWFQGVIRKWRRAGSGAICLPARVSGWLCAFCFYLIVCCVVCFSCMHASLSLALFVSLLELIKFMYMMKHLGID